jgi:hypothetical protein
MTEETQQNQVQALLMQLAGAEILNKLVERTMATLTEADYRRLADAIISGHVEKLTKTGIGYDVERQLQAQFWNSHPVKDLSAAYESRIIAAVRQAFESMLDRIAAEVASNWSKPVLQKIRTSFDEALEKNR